METENFRNVGGDSSMMIQSYIQELLDIGLRRKWLILSIMLVCVIAAGTYAWFKPEIYRSSTVILVEHQKIPDHVVQDMVKGRVAERVSTITQQVLSRTSLQRVIEELNLYPESINARGYDPVIAGMKKNVELKTKGSGGRLESFTISFSHRDPMTAMKVTAKIASQYIDENLKMREQFVEGASEFLEQELAIARKELDAKEKVLSEYRLENLGELPGQMDTNLRSLDRLQEEKTSIQETLNSLSARVELIQKSMHDYEAMAGALAELPGMEGQIETEIPPADPLERHLAKLKDDLASMLVEYTESYPDVITLKNHIKHAEEQIAKNAADSDLGAGSEENFTGEDLLGLSTTPSSNFDPYLQELAGSVSEVKSQIATLKDRRKRINVQMKGLQRKIDATPTREQELLILERDYANMQENYQRLHEKQLNSRISENLEKRQKAERFRVLDPANLPTMPEGPPRYLIVIAGFVFGFGLGYAIAFALEQWKPTFRRSEDAEISIGLPILATIPSFQIAYGKSFKSLALDSPAVGNGHNGKSSSKTNYLSSGVPAKSTNGKAKQAKNGVPRELGLVSKWRPGSIVAEQYRVAATRLNLLHSNDESTVVLVTSAMKAEGKTSTVANLAYTLAHDLDEPTLVIDCDFKCPALHEVMSLSPDEPGLAEYLEGDEPLEACMHQIDDNPLWVLPVGNIDVNPIPLAKFSQLANVIAGVKSRFRYILLDTPPVLPLADINVLTGLAEILLFVVRSGSTPKDVALKAREMLKTTAQSRIILTDAWSQGMPYYVRQGYEVPYAIGEQG